MKPHHKIVVDLMFGDSGKGTMVDYFCRKEDIHTVIRFNGGVQAAHHVVCPSGKIHRFSQFGSGTFAGARTWLSKYVLVDPIRLAKEAEALEGIGDGSPYDLLTIDGRCLITTPFHARANQMKELARGEGRHGSCGVGVGETMAYELNTGWGLRVMDCENRTEVYGKLRNMLDVYVEDFGSDFLDSMPSCEDLVDCYMAFFQRVVAPRRYDDLSTLLNTEQCVFEGAQGILLDEWYGFHPYTTWSTTTPANANEILREAGYKPNINVTAYGLLRAYTTRHGAGPFPTEDPTMLEHYHEPHNGTGKWQGDWRVGHFDSVLARYACDVFRQTNEGCKPALVITHVDTTTAGSAKYKPTKVVSEYNVNGMRVERLVPKPPDRLEDLDYQERLTESLFAAKPVYPENHHGTTARIERELGIPACIYSYGQKATDKRHHREGFLAEAV